MQVCDVALRAAALTIHPLAVVAPRTASAHSPIGAHPSVQYHIAVNKDDVTNLIVSAAFVATIEEISGALGRSVRLISFTLYQVKTVLVSQEFAVPFMRCSTSENDATVGGKAILLLDPQKLPSGVPETERVISRAYHLAVSDPQNEKYHCRIVGNMTIAIFVIHEPPMEDKLLIIEASNWQRDNHGTDCAGIRSLLGPGTARGPFNLIDLLRECTKKNAFLFESSMGQQKRSSVCVVCEEELKEKKFYCLICAFGVCTTKSCSALFPQMSMMDRLRNPSVSRVRICSKDKSHALSFKPFARPKVPPLTLVSNTQLRSEQLANLKLAYDELMGMSPSGMYLQMNTPSSPPIGVDISPESATSQEEAHSQEGTASMMAASASVSPRIELNFSSPELLFVPQLHFSS